MRISVLTLFPEYFSSFMQSPITKRAMDKGNLDFETVDIKEFADGSFRAIDDSPYGGGPGMILRVDVIAKALESVKDKDSHTILLSPRGRTFNQAKAHELKDKKHLVFICGHYEGVDERVSDLVDEEISIGDFILTGGEPAAMVICDSVIRLLKGSIRDSSTTEESFETGLLEYPQYTHPLRFLDKVVPNILLSGNDKEIASWRMKQAIISTIDHRPDLFDRMPSEGIGLSGAKMLFFDDMVLKIQKESEISNREVEAMRWLKGRLPVPGVLYHVNKDGMSYLLMTKLKGRMLCDPIILHNRNRLLKSCAAALKMLWQVDLTDCPFLKGNKGNPDLVLSHGDFCLPNILVDNKGVTGFLDLGYCTVSSRQDDIDSCLESLDANLVGRFSDGTETEPVDRPYFKSLL